MKVNYTLSNGNLYFYLIGELDECTAQNTRAVIDDVMAKYSKAKNVVFNFSSLSFMDSTGIGMLLGRYKKIKAKGMGVFIESPSTTVEKIMQISGLYKIMPKI
ncbi:MAG: anti-sigma factor antagonist [Clostridia bacterium]|nr:anti-sigma factor antagonist [Clostridia bacterium]